MAFTTINDAWVEFEEQCGGDVPLWDKAEFREELDKAFPRTRYENLTPENISTLVQKMWSESEQCAYCGATVHKCEVPGVNDDGAWDELLAEHEVGCEWAATRAHRI